jgi:hypothetical protein
VLSNSNSFGVAGTGRTTPSWLFPVTVWTIRPGQRWRTPPS